MTVETVIDKSLSSVLAEITTAMVDATKEYGPEAVDLALLVYRLDAAKSLLVAITMITACVIFMRVFFKSLIKRFPGGDQEVVFIHALVGTFGVPFFGIIAIKVNVVELLIPITILLTAFYNLFTAGKNNKNGTSS